MLFSHFATSSFCHDKTLLFASCIGGGVDNVTSDCIDTRQQKNFSHFMFHSYRSIALLDDGRTRKNQLRQFFRV